jgi:hypothetical protein
MARQQISSESLRSIAGAVLVGLGLHILFTNLDKVATHSRQIFGTGADAAFGLLPGVVLSVSHAARAYASNHQGFLLGIVRMLVSFWPALLVVFGTILLWDFTDKAKVLPTRGQCFQEITFKNKNNRCRFGRPSFDV